jgi:condensin complex subunit 1
MMHGGTLNLPEWQERYDQISAELAKVDAQELEKAKRDVGYESDEEEQEEVKGADAEEGAEKKSNEDNGEAEKTVEDDGEGEDEGEGEATPKAKYAKKPRQSQLDISAIQAEQSTLDAERITRLRLTKKYYADALRFINQIESAVPILCQLLVSTSKSEVLEAMRFFRTAYEYNISSAESGIKTMLHLIWTKDNNSTAASTEEGIDGRSIKGNLIDVYRSLYFDVVPDLSPKQQVSRIAKNMIECVNTLTMKTRHPLNPADHSSGARTTPLSPSSRPSKS